MKVLMVSSSDIQGGAARAAFRLYQGLQRIGLSSQMLVQSKLSDEKKVISDPNKINKELAKLSHRIDRLPLQIYPNRTREAYSLQWLPDRAAKQVNHFNPDIINLHWIFAGYLKIETIAKLNKPIVWTLHDMWVFTGGCHYSLDCDRYQNACGNCPQLGSNKDWDLSRWVWQRKAKAWQNLNLTIVTPSAWLANCTKSSSLFKNVRVEVIANGLDTAKYRPIDRSTARELLKLPQDKQILLFGAVRATTHNRKGFHLLQSALQELSKSGWRDKIEIVIFGASGASEQTDFGFQPLYLGQLNDDISLALAYAAADVFVLPSIQDNLPNTIMEALSCGTPCVGFDIGGIPDMIEHQKNGYIAESFKIEDLARGIIWVLENKERHQKLCDRAREKVEKEFTLEIVASRYSSIFSQMVHERDR